MLFSDRAQKNPYHYNGRNIELNIEIGDQERSSLNQAYLWLRGNTNPDDYILEYPGLQDNLELSVLSQRRIIAAEGRRDFIVRIPHHQMLVEFSKKIIAKISSGKLTSTDLDHFFRIPAPWPERIYALVKRHGSNELDLESGGEYMLPEEVSLVFKNNNFVIFQIDHKKIRNL